MVDGLFPSHRVFGESLITFQLTFAPRRGIFGARCDCSISFDSLGEAINPT
jgi:hypothetical protein